MLVSSPILSLKSQPALSGGLLCDNKKITGLRGELRWNLFTPLKNLFDPFNDCFSV
jgi:hypothetical protein